jgi:diketogulonate reductase-like aldo/keto reductase
MRTYAETLDAWRVLIGLQDEGKARAIGISNVYDAAVLEKLGRDAGRKVQVVQDRWYEGNGWDRDVVEWCQRNGVQYQCVVLHEHPSLMMTWR